MKKSSVSSIKRFAALLLAAALLALAACVGGANDPTPFTKPPQTDLPGASASPAVDPSASGKPAAEGPSLLLRSELPSTILGLFISPSERAEWGEAVLNDWQSGSDIELAFSSFAGVPGELYDIGTIDENGVNYDFFELVLLDGDSIVISGNEHEAELTLRHADGSVKLLDAYIHSDEHGEGKRSDYLTLNVLNESERIYSEQVDGWHAAFEYSGVVLSEECAERYALLNITLSAAQRRQHEVCEKEYASLLSEAEAYFAAHPDQNTGIGLENRGYIRRADDNLLSILYRKTVKDETGSRHITYSGENFDPQTGEQLMLSDVLEDPSALPAQIFSELEKRYGELPIDEDIDLLGLISKPTDKLVWTLGSTGLGIRVAALALGIEGEAGEDGYYRVFLPLNEYTELIKDQYLPMHESYTAAFACGMELDQLFGGKRGTLAVNVDANEYGDVERMEIVFNDSRYTEDVEDIFGVEPLYVRANDKDYLYLKLTGINYYCFLAVYELDGANIRRIGEFHSSWKRIALEDRDLPAEQQMIDPSSFELTLRTSLLSSADGHKRCYIGSDGMPHSDEAFYTIDGEVELTLLAPLELHFAAENGDVEVGTVALETGTALRLIRTDDESFADLQLKDGRIVRAYVSEDRTVEGTDIFELFDGIVFSG